MGTKTEYCPTCGTKESSTYPCCANCYSEAVLDGSTEMNRLAYQLKDLRNRKWLEEELKMVADSHAFAWLCERCLPLMDAKCFANLLKKVGQRL
jgi:hypothetical protein